MRAGEPLADDWSRCLRLHLPLAFARTCKMAGWSAR
jgi:hypothetical protein